MDKKSKSSISTFLMLVGVLFILVAGSIFVTTTWRYLPDLVKQLCLLILSVVFFATSALLTKGEKLRKTAAALYYLGTGFAGFYVMAAFGGIDPEIADYLWSEGMNLAQWNACKILVASLVMLGAMALRFVLTKRGCDLILSVLLLDSSIICISALTQKQFVCFATLLAVLVVGIAAADSYCVRFCPEASGLHLALSVLYLLHLVPGIPVSFMVIEESENLVLAMLPSLLLVLASFLTYHGRKNTAYRVINSIAILYGLLAVVYSTDEVFAWSEHLQHDVMVSHYVFPVFAVYMVIWLLLWRKEMLVIEMVIGIGMSFFQWIGFELISWGDTLCEFYYPYSLVLAGGILIWLHSKEKQLVTICREGHWKKAWIGNPVELSAEELRLYKNTAWFMTACVELAIGLALWFTATHEYFLEHIFWLWLAGGNLMLSFLVRKSQSRKAIWHTLALLALAVDGMVNPLVEMCREDELVWYDFTAEYNCVILGLCIVLLGSIWYHKKEMIRRLQLVGVCLLLAALLLCNMGYTQDTAIYNVLFLGVGAVIMLIVAAARNHREYVIAASTTLVLLVIYITREFWMSIAWWVYLFVAGVVLVVLAVGREKRDIEEE